VKTVVFSAQAHVSLVHGCPGNLPERCVCQHFLELLLYLRGIVFWHSYRWERGGGIKTKQFSYLFQNLWRFHQWKFSWHFWQVVTPEICCNNTHEKT